MHKLLLIVMLAIASCAAEHEEVTHELSADDLGMSAEAYQYLDSALSIMESYSIRRDSIDWPELRRRSLVAAKGAQSMTDTYPSIQVALAGLGDNHSYFVSADEVKEGDTTSLSGIQPPTASIVAGRYGYIRMYGVFVGTGDAQREYIAYLRNLIRELDRQQTCGWIVDLRNNNGGAIWPMLAGLEPVLGNGCVGMFRGLMHAHWPWIVHEDRVLSDTFEMAVISGPPFDLHHSPATIAVLTGKLTGSAGEAVAVAFRERPNTRSFGEPTAGVPTGISGFFLPDSAVLGLACTWFVDRNGNVYDTEIQPDELVRYLSHWTYENALDDPVIRAATEWLAKQEPCR